MARHSRRRSGPERPSAGSDRPGEAGSVPLGLKRLVLFTTLAGCTVAGLTGVVWLWWAGRAPEWFLRSRAGSSEAFVIEQFSVEGHTEAASSPELAEVATLKHEVIGVARQLIRDFPENPAALAVTAQLQYRLGHSAQAVACWQECLRLDPGFLDAYFKMALIASERGDYQQAADHFRALLVRAPGTPHAVTGLAEVLIHQGQTPEAIAILEDLRQRETPSPAILMLLGQALLQTKEYARAKESYEQVLQMDPDHTRAYHGLASACARLGLTDQAQRYLEKYEESRAAEKTADPDPGGVRRDLKSMRQCAALVHNTAAAVYAAQGQTQTAEEHWRRTAAVDPADVASREALWEICRRDRRPEDALRMLEELCRLQPENPRHLLLRGSLLVQLDRWDEAEQVFHEACRLAPQRGAGYTALAQLYLRAGRKLDEAVALARQAVELEPAGRSYAVLGEALARSGDRDGARQAWEQALQLEPDNVEYLRQIQTISARP